MTQVMSVVRRVVAVVQVVAAAVLLVQCTTATQTSAADPPSSDTDSPPPIAPSAPVSLPPAPSGASVHPVTAAELGATWHPGCPLEPERLRRVEVNYLGFDGETHRGALIVHEDLVPEVITIFEQLYALSYPIEKIRTVDHYPGAEDELSMRDNNTSAFNCRDIPGTGQWSYHAYGRAIDVNPLINPFIDSSGAFQPSNAGPYLDRNRLDPGMLRSGDPAVRAFTDRGWQWGGNWTSPIDYQHFERP